MCTTIVKKLSGIGPKGESATIDSF